MSFHTVMYAHSIQNELTHWWMSKAESNIFLWQRCLFGAIFLANLKFVWAEVSPCFISNNFFKFINAY